MRGYVPALWIVVAVGLSGCAPRWDDVSFSRFASLSVNGDEVEEQEISGKATHPRRDITVCCPLGSGPAVVVQIYVKDLHQDETSQKVKMHLETTNENGSERDRRLTFELDGRVYAGDVQELPELTTHELGVFLSDCDQGGYPVEFGVGMIWSRNGVYSTISGGEKYVFRIYNECLVVDPGQGNALSEVPDMLFGKKLDVNGEDNFQLFAVNPDATGLQRVTDNTDRDRLPGWSWDGTKLAFVSNRFSAGEDSYEAALAEGTIGNVRRITHETGAAQVAQVAAARKVTDIAWSPDDTKLAYSAGGDILVIGIAPGSAAVELTQGAEDDRGPTWSQDGARIAFLRGMELWVMDADGSDEEFLLDQVLAAAWSPIPAAGRRIAVVRAPDGLSTLEDDGSLVPFGDGTAPLNGLALAWSPDGEAIAIHEETETIWIVRETGTTAISVGVPGDRIEGLTWRAPPP